MKADWLSVDQALRTVVDGVRPLDLERCPVRSARGRVLAEDLIASVDVPCWTNSAMDGFAVRAVDIQGASDSNPVTLRVVEDVRAGGFPERAIGEGEATRVMTGAPVPDGADGVVRVEHTDGGKGIGTPAASVRVMNDVDAGRNLRRSGEDLRAGAVALKEGTLLSAAGVGVAASLGYADVAVLRRPEVALLTSGDELVEVEDFERVLAGERIVSSNSYTLAAQLEEIGCRVRYLGIAADTPEALGEALERARGCDALITSAGISVGEHDHVKGVLSDLGAAAAFWRVRMRPGSPFAFGTVAGLDGIPWFGLPGNPVSTMVTFEIFARPALLKMSGYRRIYRRPLTAVLEEDFTAPAGLTQFVRVTLREVGGVWRASPTGAQGSGILSSLARADGLMVVPAAQEGARAGSSLSVLPFDVAGASEEVPALSG